MNKFARHFLPLSLRVRFLLATAGVVLVLSLAYGIVALVGYSVSLIKPPFVYCAAKATCFIPSPNGKIIKSALSCLKIWTCKARP